MPERTYWWVVVEARSGDRLIAGPFHEMMEAHAMWMRISPDLPKGWRGGTPVGKTTALAIDQWETWVAREGGGSDQVDDRKAGD